MPCCPKCSHSWGARKNGHAVAHPGAEASIEAIYAYYKATAPVEDVRFFASQVGGAYGERASMLLDVVLTLPRAEVYRRLTVIQDDWRQRDIMPADETAFWAYHSSKA